MHCTHWTVFNIYVWALWILYAFYFIDSLHTFINYHIALITWIRSIDYDHRSIMQKLFAWQWWSLMNWPQIKKKKVSFFLQQWSWIFNHLYQVIFLEANKLTNFNGVFFNCITLIWGWFSSGADGFHSVAQNHKDSCHTEV